MRKRVPQFKLGGRFGALSMGWMESYKRENGSAEVDKRINEAVTITTAGGDVAQERVCMWRE